MQRVVKFQEKAGVAVVGNEMQIDVFRGEERREEKGERREEREERREKRGGERREESCRTAAARGI